MCLIFTTLPLIHFHQGGKKKWIWHLRNLLAQIGCQQNVRGCVNLSCDTLILRISLLFSFFLSVPDYFSIHIGSFDGPGDVTQLHENYII